MSAIVLKGTMPKGQNILQVTKSVLKSAICTQCHHEWQQVGKKPEKCDWCGAPGKMLPDSRETTRNDRGR